MHHNFIIFILFFPLSSIFLWENIHKGLEEAKVILIKNQYPRELIEKTFHNTLTKIIKPDAVDNDERKSVTRSDSACLFDV